MLVSAKKNKNKECLIISSAMHSSYIVLANKYMGTCQVHACRYIYPTTPLRVHHVHECIMHIYKDRSTYRCEIN